MRLRQVALVARRLQPVVDDLSAVLGLDVAFRDPGVGEFGLENAIFAIGDTFLEVVSPVRPGVTAERFLDRRGGDGGYMAIFQTDDLAADRRRLVRLGVRIVWEIAFDDIATIHLHPRDVGGAIVSLDEARPRASWRWAGPEWQRYARRDRVLGIDGVEIASEHPLETGARWGSVLDLRFQSAGDRGEIQLEGGVVRFSRTAGRASEGICAIRLAAADADQVRAAARARGCLDVTGEIAIGGVRFELHPDEMPRARDAR